MNSTNATRQLDSDVTRSDDERSTKNRQRVGATKGAETAIKDRSQAVDTLGAVIKRRLPNDELVVGATPAPIVASVPTTLATAAPRTDTQEARAAQP